MNVSFSIRFLHPSIIEMRRCQTNRIGEVSHVGGTDIVLMYIRCVHILISQIKHEIDNVKTIEFY